MKGRLPSWSKLRTKRKISEVLLEAEEKVDKTDHYSDVSIAANEQNKMPKVPEEDPSVDMADNIVNVEDDDQEDDPSFIMRQLLAKVVLILTIMQMLKNIMLARQGSPK
ncbi:hypothetical protein O6H91_20G056500 [Diphasiastrum complanatum]|uniref:Uncharacterized protein n=1 Tax=Diphasiastrum complanatum TaxID=34168 RepID=A0ACC2AQE2_DIPCM|nr:hypothetical protein O6H91_20G056500 [Diphasiastrum complanatum]